MIWSEEQRTRTAYQEGGHAVMMVLVGEGARIARVTIIPNLATGMAGGVFIEPPLNLATDDEARRIIHIFGAGLQAEYRCCMQHNARLVDQVGRWDPDETWDRIASDAEVMAAAIDHLDMSEEDQKTIQRETAERIMRAWPVVDRLAMLLLAEQELSGEQVRVVIAEALAAMQMETVE